jgi:isocitrate dehydrogenase (NAD+)
MITAAIMMLRHISERAAANRIYVALEKTLWRGDCVTRDLGGTASTKKFTEAIIKEIER